MKLRYTEITNERLQAFAQTSTIVRLVQAESNIVEYIEKCDYSIQNLTEVLSDPTYELHIKRIQWAAKNRIEENRKAALRCLKTIRLAIYWRQK